MILYNLTVHIATEKEKDFVKWMKEVHIPEVMATGLFEDNKFFKLLLEVEEGGINYSTQYFAKSLEDVRNYQANFAGNIHKKLKDRFGDQVVYFGSLLEQIDL